MSFNSSSFPSSDLFMPPLASKTQDPSVFNHCHSLIYNLILASLFLLHTPDGLWCISVAKHLQKHHFLEFLKWVAHLQCHTSFPYNSHQLPHNTSAFGSAPHQWPQLCNVSTTANVSFSSYTGKGRQLCPLGVRGVPEGAHPAGVQSFRSGESLWLTVHPPQYVCFNPSTSMQ